MSYALWLAAEVHGVPAVRQRGVSETRMSS